MFRKWRKNISSSTSQSFHPCSALLSCSPVRDARNQRKCNLTNFHPSFPRSSLVKEGKTCYCSTLGFEEITGQPVQGLEDFFKSYADEFKVSGKLSKKRKAKNAGEAEKGGKGEKNGGAKEKKGANANKKQKKNDEKDDAIVVDE